MRDITPQPGFVEQDVIDLLLLKQFVYAELFTITPLEGPVMRFTNVQQSVSALAFDDVNMYTWNARQVIITGLRARATIGVEVDEQEITIAYPETELYQSYLAWPEALKQGRLDGAVITRDRVVAQTWDGDQTVWVGIMRMFSGEVSDLGSVGRSKAVVRVKSSIERLAVPMPRDLFTPVCKNTLGDARCGVDLASLGVLGIIDAGPITRSAIPWASSSTDYNFGKLHISDTNNVTRVRTILRATPTHIYLILPLDFDPEAGMEFTAFPGCSRLFARCGDFHVAPEEHFGGFPTVPVAETAA